jgi:predicted RNA-binding protein
MCQMSVMLDQNGQQKKIMDNVTQLEVTPEGVTLSALFEEPKFLVATRIKKIDFLSGTLTLVASNKAKDE